MQSALKKSLRKKPTPTTDKGLERAGEILDAASAMFAADGYASLSMRGIAARVGITLGTVQHYYPTKEVLFEAMLLHMLDELQVTADRAADSSSSPKQQFREAMLYFIATVRSPSGQGTFTELKALAMRDAFAAGIMETIFLQARKSIGRRIRALVPTVKEHELTLRSALVLAQLMGLTYLEQGTQRRRRAELDGLEEQSVRVMLGIALGE